MQFGSADPDDSDVGDNNPSQISKAEDYVNHELKSYDFGRWMT